MQMLLFLLILQFFRLERAEAGLMFRPSLFKKAGSIFVSPSCSPPSAQLELLLISGGAHVSLLTLVAHARGLL